MSTFRREGAACVARFSPEEAQILRQVATEVVTLLTNGFDREDPAVARLFPDVYPDDPAAASEFREFTDGELKSAKIDQAGAMLATLPAAGGADVTLDEEAAEAWLRALNDVRLALGVRLGLDHDTDLERELDKAIETDPRSSRAGQLSLYAYLGYLQESLLTALAE